MITEKQMQVLVKKVKILVDGSLQNYDEEVRPLIELYLKEDTPQRVKDLLQVKIVENTYQRIEKYGSMVAQARDDVNGQDGTYETEFKLFDIDELTDFFINTIMQLDKDNQVEDFLIRMKNFIKICVRRGKYYG